MAAEHLSVDLDQSIRMLSVVVCPDKFRGSLSAAAAAAAMTRGLRAAGLTAITEVPIADGGEGTLDVLLAVSGGSRRSVEVTGPLGDLVLADYGVLPDGTAIIEMAQASGLARCTNRDALRASTRGTGELIAAASRAGARRIVVGVGGSATTDGGLAAVQTLAWSLVGLDVSVACDVETYFLDAAREFGPQKGATAAQVELLSRRLSTVAQEYFHRTGIDVTVLPRAGAAGGLAGGLAAIGARLESGFSVVANATGLDEIMASADLVITGEGSADNSTFSGKAVGEVLSLARERKVANRVVIAGQISPSARQTLGDDGVQAIALVDLAREKQDSFRGAVGLIEAAAESIGRALN